MPIICQHAFALLILSLVTLGACGTQQESTSDRYVQYVGETMGTTYSIKHVDIGKELKPSIDEALQEVNMALSTYIPESLISQFNQKGELKVPVSNRSDHFVRNIETALRVHDKSNGAFDPTLGPLINAWGFGWQGRQPHSPSAERIDSLLSLVDMSAISFKVTNDSLSVSTDIPGMILDMSALAKGYGVDVVAHLLEGQGIDHYFVEIGGEVRTKGSNPSGKSWVVGISRPEEGAAPMDFYTTVSISGKSMATSGNYRNYYIVDGEKVWHTLNPVTGYPEKTPILSASIVHDNCMMADAMATACLVMGAEKCLDFVKAMGGDAFLILSDEEMGMRDMQTGFDKYIKNQ